MVQSNVKAVELRDLWRRYKSSGDQRARERLVALYQGAAETGPRALGHRSILANPCDPEARERLNERVKYREAIRPLATMATLEAALEYFDLLEGASDADYNAAPAPVT